MEASLIKVLIPATLAFVIGILVTPIVTHFLYKYRVWKKVGGKNKMGGGEATEFNRLKGDGETKTPRMGGIVIWSSVFITVLLLSGLATLFPDTFLSSLNFISRSQTLIPLATLFIGAAVGFVNDVFDVTRNGRGLKLRVRLLVVTTLSSAIGWWFYSKLGIEEINLPFDGTLYLGIFIIAFFVILANVIYASGVIDGIDGLAGGVFASIFTAYAGVALVQSQFDIAAFCATISGAILAFLWFNIPPARFWMTETGTMALTLTLFVVIVLTDSLGDGHGIFLMFIICLPLLVTVLSNVIQISYRLTTGKKFFRIAPLHHHFEAIGWSAYKVTMRYWVISIVCAITGIVLASII